MIIDARGGKVHHQHAGAGPALEFLGVEQRTRADAGGEAEAVAVQRLDRGVEAVHAADAGDGSEYIVMTESVRRRHVFEERRSIESLIQYEIGEGSRRVRKM